jgi:hypothetical protein
VKEITVVGSRCGPFEKAIALLRAGKVDPRPLVTGAFPLAEAPKAIAFAQRAGVMKVLLKPQKQTLERRGAEDSEKRKTKSRSLALLGMTKMQETV